MSPVTRRVVACAARNRSRSAAASDSTLGSVSVSRRVKSQMRFIQRETPLIPEPVHAPPVSHGPRNIR